jgi:hypothetical protein
MSRLAGQAVHHAQIAGTETKKLKGQIFDLERKAGLRPLIRPSSGVSHRMGDSLDVLGHIPWHPAGRGRSTTPLCKASPEMTNVSLLHHCHMFILGTFVGGSTCQKWWGCCSVNKASHDMNAINLH